MVKPRFSECFFVIYKYMMVFEKENSDLGSSLGVEPDEWDELLRDGSGIEERKNEFIQSSLGNRDYVKSALERDLNDVILKLAKIK